MPGYIAEATLWSARSGDHRGAVLCLIEHSDRVLSAIALLAEAEGAGLLLTGNKMGRVSIPFLARDAMLAPGRAFGGEAAEAGAHRVGPPSARHDI